METPAQLVIGSDIFNNLKREEQLKFNFYFFYKDLNNKDWCGDNYFYDADELIYFWGANDIKEINGAVYVRIFDNLTREEEICWKSLSSTGKQIKIYWC